MFDALKKKLASWFSKEKEDKENRKSTKKTEKKAKKKPKTEKKPVKTPKIAAKEKTEKPSTTKKVEPLIEEIPKEEKPETLKEKIEKEAENIKEETSKEEEKEEKKEGFFSRFIKKIAPGTTTLKQEQIDEIFSEIELTLLENNVALEVVDKIKENLSKDLLGIEVKKDKIEQTILDSLKNSILEVLIEPPNLIENINKNLGPYTIIFFGINGSGKTTSIAKLASLLKKSGISCVLAAADTFRAASIEQLQKHADSLGIPIIKHDYGSDPAAVAFDAKKYAEAHNIKAVLIDTAGRMYTKQNLIKEMEKIIRVSKPNLKIFVGESITGNDAVEQAKTFNEAVDIDGIILTKADVDEKAGTILSVSYITNKPIYFLGVGQEYSDMAPFTKSDVLKNLGLDS